MLARQLLLRPAGRQLSRPVQIQPRFPRASALGLGAGRWTARTWETTTTGDDHCGHIAAAHNESILFFDNIFPLGFTHLLRRPFRDDDDLSDLLKRFENSSLGVMDPIMLVKRAIPESLPVKVTEILPRLKDGGAFVKIRHPIEIAPSEIEGTLTKLLEETPLKPWFNPFRGIKARLIKGVPWLEDLDRMPTGRVKVEFVPKEAGLGSVELSQETLFSLFRRYGKISDINSQPSDSKVVPRYAYLDFRSTRDAIMARNCLHGLVVDEAHGGGKDGTRIRLSFERRVKAHAIWDWLTNHPRLVIPVLAALAAAITVIIFDPIRQFFVRVHVQHSFRFTNTWLYRWFKSRTQDIFTLGRRDTKAGLNSVWTHRRELIEQLQDWLQENSDTFIVVQGPRGSGKKELVLDQSLQGRRNVLVLDCKPVVEARGESGTIKKLAASVGYRPVFSWANSISSMLDLVVQSTTGVKAGFSETLETQVVKILQTAAAALKEVSLSGRQKGDKDAALSEDAFLEAHPERRAVVVIDNFLHKNDEASIVYDKVAEWAALLVANSIAQVVFLTDDGAYSKSLSRALPDRVFRQVALGDLAPDVAKAFVVSRLEEEDRDAPAQPQQPGPDGAVPPKPQRPDLDELDSCVETLGGRLADLEALARRIRSGQAPKRAVQEIVDQSAAEIVKMFLLGNGSNGGPGDDDRRWSTEQAWFLIRALADRETLRYNEVLLADTFAASATPGEAALEALAGTELVAVRSVGGRPYSIRAGRPMYRAAFRVLRGDAVLRARLDVALLAELATVEARAIAKAEAELALLGGLPRQPAQTAGRVRYLLDKVEVSHGRIRGYEAEMAALKQVLKEEY